MKKIDFMLIALVMIIQLPLTSICAQVNYDFEIDYFPTIKSIGIEGETFISMKNDLEFIVTLENILKDQLADENIKLKAIPGFQMKNSGIVPKMIAESKMILSIEIDEKGKVVAISIWGNNGIKYKKESEILLRKLKSALILPALKSGNPVRSIFFYKVK